VLDQKVILRRILQKRGLTAPLRDEKKGLTIRFNQWLGRNDWDRSSYCALLRNEWSKAYGPFMTDRCADGGGIKAVARN
jgi:hypothetical protein